MNTNSKKHYDQHLGPIYSWMCQKTATTSDDIRRRLANMGLYGPGVAVDLGCGHGLQSIPLAELGYDVTAVDFCEGLLDELQSLSKHLSISTVCEDLMTFNMLDTGSVDAVVCMGDTLTHMESFDGLMALLQRGAGWLKSNGSMVLSYRDYFTTELKGNERFILVGQDRDLVLSCFLEYEAEVVNVNDIIFRRQSELWEQSVSSYPKLRVDPDWVDFSLAKVGMTKESSDSFRGMLTVKYVKRDGS